MKDKNNTLWLLCLIVLVVGCIILGLYSTDVIGLPDIVVRIIGILIMAVLFGFAYSSMKKMRRQ